MELGDFEKRGNRLHSSDPSQRVRRIIVLIVPIQRIAKRGY